MSVLPIENVFNKKAKNERMQRCIFTFFYGFDDRLQYLFRILNAFSLFVLLIKSGFRSRDCIY